MLALNNQLYTKSIYTFLICVLRAPMYLSAPTLTTAQWFEISQVSHLQIKFIKKNETIFHSIVPFCCIWMKNEVFLEQLPKAFSIHFGDCAKNLRTKHEEASINSWFRLESKMNFIIGYNVYGKINCNFHRRCLASDEVVPSIALQFQERQQQSCSTSN